MVKSLMAILVSMSLGLLAIVPERRRQRNYRAVLARHWDWAEDNLPPAVPPRPGATRVPIGALGITDEREWAKYESPTCQRWGDLGPVGKRLQRRVRARLARKRRELAAPRHAA